MGSPGQPQSGQPQSGQPQPGRAEGAAGQNGHQQNDRTEAPRPWRYDESDPVVNVERQVLKLAMQRPALCGPAFDQLPASVFTVPAHAAVREMIAACGGVAGVRSAREWAEQLREAAPNDTARSFVTRLIVEPIEAPGQLAEPDARYAEAVLARVEELAVSREIAEIKRRLQRLSPVTEQGDYNRLFGDLVALEQRKKVVGEHAAGAL
jgi:DNA primase